jgi:ADP-ribose pyrophosphatase YjhB (NUDIX family)
MPSALARLVRRLRRLAFDAYRYSPRWLRRLVIRTIAPTFTAGAAVVFRRADGRVLLVDQRHTGAWALPGGLVRRGEPANVAAAREVSEEVGIVVDPAELSRPIAILDAERRAVDVVFVEPWDTDQRATRGDPVEVTRVGWFFVDDLPSVTDPTITILHGAGLI